MSNPAETYESYMVPALFAPSARHLVDDTRPAPGHRVLDVACGTGIVARLVAPRVRPGGHVSGLDLSPAMLAVARRVAARDGVAVAWHEGRAEALPFDDGTFDLVLCQYALMFLADRSKALAEMHRVLVSNGRVALSVWQGLDRHPFYRALDDAIARRLGASSVADIFALGDPEGLRALLVSSGFRDVSVAPWSVTARFPDPGGFLAGEIDVDTASIPAMQHLDPDARQALVAAIRQDMQGPLREVTEGDHVRLAFHALVARAAR